MVLALIFTTLIACSTEPPPQDFPLGNEMDFASISWVFFLREIDNLEVVYRADLNNFQELEEVLRFEQDEKPYRVWISPNQAYAIVRQDINMYVLDLYSKETVAYIDSVPRPTTEFATVEIDNGVSWSPTSDKFAFLVDDPDGYIDIMIYDLPSKKLTNLTNNLARENALTWSLDGQKLAVASIEGCEAGLSDCPIEKQYWDIFVFDISTQNSQRITDFSSKISPEGDWIDNSICDFHWSPDQKYIAFRSYCPSDGISSYDEMYLAHIVSKEVIRLTEFGHIDYSFFYSPAWSSDGQYLVVAYSRDFVFNDQKDLSGFLSYNTANKTIIFHEFPQVTFSAFHFDWSTTTNYAISSSRNSDDSYFFAVSEGKVDLIATIPFPLLLSGLWVSDGFITQQENRLVKISIPNGDVVDMKIELPDNVTILASE